MSDLTTGPVSGDLQGYCLGRFELLLENFCVLKAHMASGVAKLYLEVMDGIALRLGLKTISVKTETSIRYCQIRREEFV
eukprot:1153346-Pelagomonas_calceolata.AAC.3